MSEQFVQDRTPNFSPMPSRNERSSIAMRTPDPSTGRRGARGHPLLRHPFGMEPPVEPRRSASSSA